MGHPQLCAELDGRKGAFQSLPRGSQHQIQRKIGKPRFASGFHRFGGLLGGMAAAQRLEFLIMGGLQTDGEPVCSGGEDLAEKAAEFRRRVYLHGDLRVLQGKVFLCRQNQPGNAVSSQQVGGAAAKIQGVCHRGYALFCELICPKSQLLFQAAGILFFDGFFPGKGIKIAVGAFAVAEGDM